MTWVCFTANFDFSPAALGGRSTVAYLAGMEMNVTRECAEQAIAAGKAEGMEREIPEPGPLQAEAPAPASGRKRGNPKGHRAKR